MPLLATYGTLRLGQGNWRAFLAHADHLGTVTIPDMALFDAGPFPYAAREAGGRIVADVFRISPEDLDRCDGLEGYPRHYDRTLVKTPFGSAWLYFAQRTPNLPRVPGGDWLRADEGHGQMDHDWPGHVTSADPARRRAGPPTHDRVYFAYGSNMSAHRMGGRCRDHVPFGRAVLNGWRLVINQRGVATITPDPAACTEGFLWFISAQDEAALDRAEGVAVGCYRREHMMVRLPSHDTDVQALVYIDDNARPGMPRPGYADILMTGARECGLSGDYCRTLAHALECGAGTQGQVRARVQPPRDRSARRHKRQGQQGAGKLASG